VAGARNLRDVVIVTNDRFYDHVLERGSARRARWPSVRRGGWLRAEPVVRFSDRMAQL